MEARKFRDQLQRNVRKGLFLVAIGLLAIDAVACAAATPTLNPTPTPDPLIIWSSLPPSTATTGHSFFNPGQDCADSQPVDDPYEQSLLYEPRSPEEAAAGLDLVVIFKDQRVGFAGAALVTAENGEFIVTDEHAIDGAESIYVLLPPEFVNQIVKCPFTADGKTGMKIDREEFAVNSATLKPAPNEVDEDGVAIMPLAFNPPLKYVVDKAVAAGALTPLQLDTDPLDPGTTLYGQSIGSPEITQPFAQKYHVDGGAGQGFTEATGLGPSVFCAGFSGRALVTRAHKIAGIIEWRAGVPLGQNVVPPGLATHPDLCGKQGYLFSGPAVQKTIRLWMNKK